jgi:hypothetical protein
MEDPAPTLRESVVRSVDRGRPQAGWLPSRGQHLPVDDDPRSQGAPKTQRTDRRRASKKNGECDGDDDKANAKPLLAVHNVRNRKEDRGWYSEHQANTDEPPGGL